MAALQVCLHMNKHCCSSKYRLCGCAQQGPHVASILRCAFARYVGSKGSLKGWTIKEPWALQTWLLLLQHIPCSSSRSTLMMPPGQPFTCAWQALCLAEMVCKCHQIICMSITSHPVGFTLPTLYCWYYANCPQNCIAPCQTYFGVPKPPNIQTKASEAKYAL